MKTLLLTLAIFLGMTIQGFSQAETTIVKSIEFDQSSNVTLAFAGAVETVEWDKEYIRITATVNSLNTTQGILDRLAMLGRYDIQTKTQDGATVISMPKLANHITIKGTDLEESIRYQVTVPKGTKTHVQTTYYSNVNQSL